MQSTTNPLTFDETARLVHLEDKPLALITEADWSELKALRSKERGGRPAPGRRFTFGPLESLESLAADRCTRETLDDLVLVPRRQIWTNPINPPVVDGVEVHLGLVAWMPAEVFAKIDAAFKAELERAFKPALHQMVFGELGRKAAADPVVLAREGAKREAEWKADRTPYGPALEGDDRWNVRKVAASAGVYTGSDPYHQPVDPGFIVSLAKHDPLLLLRMVEAEQERALSELAAFDPQGQVHRFEQKIIHDQYRQPTKLVETREVDASGFVSAMRSTLREVAGAELARRGANLGSLDTWWRRLGFERVALKIAREGA